MTAAVAVAARVLGLVLNIAIMVIYGCERDKLARSDARNDATLSIVYLPNDDLQAITIRLQQFV